MASHDPLTFVNSLSAKLAVRSRHVCALLGAGAARACGLPDIAGLTAEIEASLTKEQAAAFASLLENRNLEEALSRLRRMPFVVLHDRLRRALLHPETLMIITGYSWGDKHLNEVIFDAARDRPRSEVVVFSRSTLPEVVVEHAREIPNLQAVTGTEAVLMLVTQRPSELPDTALAQCGSLVSLRLSNQTDQAKIRSALPDSVAGLADVLPSLRTGEAIISGESVVLPSRVLIRQPDPLPKAEDPSLAPWRKPKQPAELDQALAAWREAYGQ